MTVYTTSVHPPLSTPAKPACTQCGSTSAYQWGWQSQGCEINFWIDDDGTLNYDYTGDNKDGDDWKDPFEYWCSSCDNNAPTLEGLCGLPEVEESDAESS